MTTEMRLFASVEFGTVRTLEEKGKLLFCKMDTVRALGHKRSADAVKIHCRVYTVKCSRGGRGCKLFREKSC